MNRGRKTPPPVAFLLSLGLASAPVVHPQTRDARAARAALTALWQADDDDARQRAIEKIDTATLGFDALYQALADGRDYSVDVPTGRLEREREDSRGNRYPYIVLVPDDYDSGHRYEVRFFLHGGVMRPHDRLSDGWWRDEQLVKSSRYITVLPASWSESLWWHASQVENLRQILGTLKKIYNIDEDRVYLFGVSDGATGAYFHALRSPTQWAAFLPFIGHVAVLDNPSVGADGELFANNLSNRPLFIVNAEEDRLYPARRVLPYVDLFRAAGTKVVFRHKRGGHNTRWWGAEARHFEAFIAETPRLPLPDEISWETERVDRYSRFSWVQIEELGNATSESPGSMTDVNTIEIDAIEQRQAFSRTGGSGRVDVVRQGNEVTVRTRGVLRYRLLVSPARFDLQKPLRIVTNGHVSFEGRLPPSPTTLLKWAALDDDRSMLFAAEVEVRLEPVR